jgi:Short C-terminal domain
MLRRRPIARMAIGTAVVAGTAGAVAGHAARNQAAAAPASPQPAPQPSPVAAAPPTVDPIQQLTQLAALKDSGALTQAEFDAQKAKILG